jgi:hypothetical protein
MKLSGGSAVLATVLAASSSTGHIHAERVTADARLEPRKLSGPGVISGLSLIEAITDTKVTDLTNGTIFDLTTIVGISHPAFSVNASFSGGDLGSVVFGHNGMDNVHTENVASYSF